MQEPDIIDAEYEEIDQRPAVNVGTIGHIDHGKSGLYESLNSLAGHQEAHILESDNSTNISNEDYTSLAPQEYGEPETPRSRVELLAMLEEAHENGHVTKTQYKKMRRDLGASGSGFTKKTTSSTKRKSKRAAAKKARRKQRK